ncbi:MAG: hypothetical protein JWL64_377 [Frankiales bacterium]|nr:hypothetical protein [Frankiales bacterium]
MLTRPLGEDVAMGHGSGYQPEYDHVPDGTGREVDPHWLDLQRGTSLPTSLLPAYVPGRHAPWRRVAALGLIGLLVSATAGGVCLTYGPQELFALLESN